MAEQIREIHAGETGAAFEALRELRPSLPDTRTEFAAFIDATLRREGYRLVGAFAATDSLDAQSSALAVTGFRVLTTLAWGTVLYVDDLSTLTAARRQGLAGLLLAWVADEAGRLGCDELHLDSGLGPTRADAHRRYYGSGLQISAFHFSRRIGHLK